ncbi:MAG: DUF2510 domain-containing protein [Frankiaceae bacterium]|nr:DUF2510 domain-containing protein [Frankiaceae bacterium]
MTFATDGTPAKPGPKLSLSLALIVLGTILGITGLALTIKNVAHNFNGTVYTTPNPISRQFDTGTFEVFFEEPANGGTPDLSASDVIVTGSDGTTVDTFDRSGSANETIGRGNTNYDGVVEFKITSPGEYTVAVKNHDGQNYFVTNTFADLAKGAAGWIVMMVVGMITGFVGVVLLIVGIVRRRRARRPLAPYGGGFPAQQPYQAPAATAPPPGWYPDPSIPGSQRYWDGTKWTDQTHNTQ